MGRSISASSFSALAILLAAASGCDMRGSGSPATKPSEEKDQSPITEADRAGPFIYLAEPLKVGMVGMPGNMEVISVVDESHAILKMWIDSTTVVGSGKPAPDLWKLVPCHNGASELVWATVPTGGIVSDHGYYFTKAGPILGPQYDERKMKLQVFKVTGTKSYTTARGATKTVFVIKPVS